MTQRGGRRAVLPAQCCGTVLLLCLRWPYHYHLLSLPSVELPYGCRRLLRQLAADLFNHLASPGWVVTPFESASGWVV